MGEARPLQPGNFELQKDFLAQEQRRISAELFETGVTSRIVAAIDTGRGAQMDVSGLGQLDKLFVPSVTRVNTNGKEETKLSLAAIQDTTKGETPSTAYGYHDIGLIDDTGTLFPYPEVLPDDAEAVHQAAIQLAELKTDGTLPGLNYNLLGIHNPNTSIQAMRPSA